MQRFFYPLKMEYKAYKNGERQATLLEMMGRGLVQSPSRRRQRNFESETHILCMLIRTVILRKKTQKYIKSLARFQGDIHSTLSNIKIIILCFIIYYQFFAPTLPLCSPLKYLYNRGVYSSRHFEIFPIPYFQHFEKLPQNFGGSYQDSL